MSLFVCAQSLNHVWVFCDPMDCSPQGPSVHGISQEYWDYWSGLLFPSPEDLPNPGIKLTSLASTALAGGFFTTEPPGKPYLINPYLINPFESYTTLMSNVEKIIEISDRINNFQPKAKKLFLSSSSQF